MKKTIFIGLILSMAIGFAFTNFTAPQTLGTISGTVYDATTHEVLEGIQVEEITSTGVLNSERTNANGKFSISVSNSPSNLRFSDPDYNQYGTKTVSFDWENTDCSNVTVYLTRNSN
ncbi:carboxypeptidase regulatory-like domain-containing protein [uncultured Sanguibacteroides sp.]|uniref:carboxypeptidase regulatory-like domain-containing protein n=1 Tax=uncultured Sanguibacteroides sp. TaxID=1635151 RepID=UPI0025EFD509|nr:carboxypeptidase regulatory-like domain-containing protein [uncultured Sanguibacteroides sp.]